MKKFALIVGLILLLSSPSYSKEDSVNVYQMPRSVVKTKLYDPYGKAYLLDSFKGEFVMAVFWSRYCAPCIKELSSLSNFAKMTENDGFRVIIISPAEEWRSAEEQARLLSKYNAEGLEFFVDKKGELGSALGIFKTPHTVLINREGQEIGRIKGAADWDSDKVIEYMYKVKSDSNLYIEINKNKPRDLLGTKSSIKAQDL